MEFNAFVSKTWKGNTASNRLHERAGMKVVRVLENDPGYPGAERTTIWGRGDYETVIWAF